MTALNKQALRKLAKALSGKEWVAFVHKASGTFAVGSLGHERGEDIIKWPGLDGQDNAESKAKFIAAANPATVLALLDELEAAEKRIAEHNFENRLLANADRDIKALRQRIAELDARTVCLPKLPVLGSNAEWYEGFAAGASGMRNECADAIRAAGIGVKGE